MQTPGRIVDPPYTENWYTARKSYFDTAFLIDYAAMM